MIESQYFLGLVTGGIAVAFVNVGLEVRLVKVRLKEIELRIRQMEARISKMEEK